MFKNQKGITLVALVITIVILIILATVSINFALSTDLFGRAEQSSDLYTNASKYEDEHLSNIDSLLGTLSNAIVSNEELPDLSE